MPIDSKALAASLERLSALDLAELGCDDAMQAAVDIVDDLFPVDGAGLMLLADDEALRYVAASDEHGRQLEQIQEQVGEGPCVESFARDKVVECTDAHRDLRYPSFAALARLAGIGAVLGVPVRVVGGPIGTLNVYSKVTHDWNDDEVRAIELFTGMLSRLLETAAGARLAGTKAEQLQFALDHRILIEQAKGALMEREGIGATEAFGLLRSVARSERRKVAEIAQRVLTGKPLTGAGA
jgi:GAF domain-containing protein